MLERPERKSLLGRPRSRWQDYINLKWIFKKQELEA
jgi:hypothetical protein